MILMRLNPEELNTIEMFPNVFKSIFPNLDFQVDGRLIGRHR